MKKWTLAGAALLAGVIVILVLLMRPSLHSDVQSRLTPVGEAGTTGAPDMAADARAEQRHSAPDDSTGLLSIAGSVLNQQGERLAGIAVIAEPRQAFADESEKVAAEQRTASDPAGRYRFSGLATGDYRIRSAESSHYPSASIIVRAGADSANLVLARRQELWLHGLVKDVAGKPLAGVRVQPGYEPLDATFSDTRGRFGIFLSLRGGAESQDSLRFSLDGYGDKRVMLGSPDPFASELTLADVRMTRIQGQATVRGSIVADDAPVPEARVFLRSTNYTDNYDTTSDARGSFVLPDVYFGEYTLTVVPSGEFRDHSQDGLKVGAAGLELRIALEPLEDARLHGQMVDILDQPVPGFSLWLTSQSARARGSSPLDGDSGGFFEANGVPVGEVDLATHSVPYIRISGVTVTRTDEPLRLTLDVGDYLLEGRVTDDHANPIAGAQLSLIWSHDSDGIASHSARNSTTDSDGYFRFSQLGPGVHTLNVSAAGYERLRIEQDVGAGRELRIELKALAAARTRRS
jgi:protocatechuate 3,4-dioxygenase beta subunit